MGEDWRNHLHTENDGTMRIKAHGDMKVDARIITDEEHLAKYSDDRGPEH